ncbi:MAG: hypothetical protein ACO35F_00925, partial [Ilumatobacteraceae bacterium]
SRKRARRFNRSEKTSGRISKSSIWMRSILSMSTEKERFCCIKCVLTLPQGVVSIKADNVNEVTSQH